MRRRETVDVWLTDKEEGKVKKNKEKERREYLESYEVAKKVKKK